LTALKRLQNEAAILTLVFVDGGLNTFNLKLCH
jgi:hypothetical protein